VVRTAPAILDWLDGITDRVDIDQEDEESDGEQKAAA
jgi:hypothetical protein